jgi:hypothetical protein
LAKPKIPSSSPLIKAQNKAYWRPSMTQTSPRLALCSLPALLSRVRNSIRNSGHASASPPENQRDDEQHKEYKKQEFRDARRRCGYTAKSKDRCHKCDD